MPLTESSVIVLQKMFDKSKSTIKLGLLDGFNEDLNVYFQNYAQFNFIVEL